MTIRKAFKDWTQCLFWGESQHELFTLARHAATARAQQEKRDEIHVPSDPRRIQYLQEVKARICAESGRPKQSTPTTEAALNAELKALGISTSPEGEGSGSLTAPLSRSDGREG